MHERDSKRKIYAVFFSSQTPSTLSPQPLTPGDATDHQTTGLACTVQAHGLTVTALQEHEKSVIDVCCHSQKVCEKR